MGVKRESEASFQKTVVELARLCGWEVWHDTDSRKNDPGFPDLHMVRNGQVIYAELKTETGKLRPDQERYQELLRAVQARAGGAVRVFVWRPSQWSEITEVLR